MSKTLVVFFVLVFSLVNLSAQAQALPSKIKNYLNNNYKGWKLVKDECYPDEPGKAIVTGDFNGDKKTDYAVKFARGKKGFLFAFLALNRGFKSFPLHDTDAEDLKTMRLDVWEKGERYELGDQNVYVRYDAPADFRCESDVGGIHLYRKGKFIGY